MPVFLPIFCIISAKTVLQTKGKQCLIIMKKDPWKFSENTGMLQNMLWETVVESGGYSFPIWVWITALALSLWANHFNLLHLILLLFKMELIIVLIKMVMQKLELLLIQYKIFLSSWYHINKAHLLINLVGVLCVPWINCVALLSLKYFVI